MQHYTCFVIWSDWGQKIDFIGISLGSWSGWGSENSVGLICINLLHIYWDFRDQELIAVSISWCQLPWYTSLWCLKDHGQTSMRWLYANYFIAHFLGLQIVWDLRYPTRNRCIQRHTYLIHLKSSFNFVLSRHIR